MTEDFDHPRQPPKLVTTKPESEIAADIKARLTAALVPVTAIFDEATQQGFVVRWDAIAPQPPYFKHHAVIGLRIERHY